MVVQDALFDAAMELFSEKGIKMTMDDLANRMHISKRTLYQTVSSKDELADMMIGHFFDVVEQKQKPIREDTTLTSRQKLHLLLTATPPLPVSAFKMNEFRYAYPNAYALMDEKLTTGWENTFKVMDEGIANGEFKSFDKVFFAQVYASSIEGLTMNYGASSGMGFNEMQEKLVSLLIDGITNSSGVENG